MRLIVTGFHQMGMGNTEAGVELIPDRNRAALYMPRACYKLVRRGA